MINEFVKHIKQNSTDRLVDIIHKNKINCNFTLVEIGARQIEEPEEPFYRLLKYFPSSKIIGFEIEKDVCDEMNTKARNGIKYYPYALGSANEKKKLHITKHPMCSSLYKPDESLINIYNNLDAACLKEETEIETITLDSFIDKYSIDNIDFIKIDVQGAELDIFKGGKKSLQNILKIVCEVEFIPIYQEQPLFGDICNFLSKYNLMFNKFLGLSGRGLKPIIADNNPNIASQHMWADAVFIHHVKKIQNLNDEKLLKLSLLATIYGSIDLAYFCLLKYDQRHTSTLAKDWISELS